MDEYLTHMTNDGIWGDEIVIFAAVNNYKTDINVIRLLPGDKRLVISIKPECEVKGGNSIWLEHIYDCHFVSLLKGTTFIKFIAMHIDLWSVTGVLPICFSYHIGYMNIKAIFAVMITAPMSDSWYE